MPKRARITDVAKEAGISIYSVSLTLNRKAEGEVSEEVQKKIFQAAQKLNYRRNREATSLKTGNSFIVSLAVFGSLKHYPVIGDLSLYRAIVSISDYIFTHNYLLTILQMDKRRNEEEWINKIQANGCDGLIFAADWPEKALGLIVSISNKLEIPHVLFHRYSPNISCTYFDYIKAGYESARYLLRHQPDCLGIINDMMSESANREKQTGIRKAVSEVSEKTVVKQVRLPVPPGLSCGFSAGAELFKAPPYPQSIFVTDNIAIPSLMLYLDSKGIKVPEDIEIIGMGDRNLIENTSPRASYIPLMIEEQSKQASKMLLSKINGTPLKSESYSAPIKILHATTTRPD